MDKMRQMEEYYLYQKHIVMKPLNFDYWMYFHNMAFAFPGLLTIY